MSAAAKHQLEFGALTKCPRCHRRKLMPGATWCPDCEAISRIMRRHAYKMEQIYDLWCKDRNTSELEAFLADDPDYQSFKTRDDLMWAYDGWLG